MRNTHQYCTAGTIYRRLTQRHALKKVKQHAAKMDIPREHILLKGNRETSAKPGTRHHDTLLTKKAEGKAGKHPHRSVQGASIKIQPSEYLHSFISSQRKHKARSGQVVTRQTEDEQCAHQSVRKDFLPRHQTPSQPSLRYPCYTIGMAAQLCESR